MNQLMNFLQAASNTAASNVSGPVDLIAEALRAAGVPVPRNALLSSEWMREKGLTAPVQQGASQVAGDTLGLLAPVAAAAKAPQIASGLLKMGENAAAPRVINRGGAAGQRGIFMGDLSKTWDSAAAAKAEALEKAGKDARAIWNETGTFRGVDGKWRQEISDHNIKPLQRTWGEAEDLKAGSSTVTRRQQALAHPALSAAYPDTKNIAVMLRPGESTSASYMSGAADDLMHDTVSMSASPRFNFKADPSTLLHELQHAVQQRQGFARGGSPGEISDLFSERAIELGKQIGDIRAGKQGADSQTLRALELEKKQLDKLLDFPFNAYRRLAGEAEARAVQSRMNLTPAQRRALFPLDSYDVPLNELIVR